MEPQDHLFFQRPADFILEQAQIASQVGPQRLLQVGQSGPGYCFVLLDADHLAQILEHHHAFRIVLKSSALEVGLESRPIGGPHAVIHGVRDVRAVQA